MRKRDIYLLIGQSNMAGRGALDGRSVPHPRVEMFNRDNAWAPAADPIHFDKPHAGVGPGLTFGTAMADHHDQARIGLVPCAVGGTPLSRWMPDGDLYLAALDRARAALADGMLKGILWHQGESDAQSLDLAKTYGSRLAEMIQALRAALDSPQCPVVIGEIGEFLDGVTRYPGASLVNAALRALPAQVPHAACVSAAGLAHAGDQVHFSTDAARELGRRYAAAMVGLAD